MVVLREILARQIEQRAADREDLDITKEDALELIDKSIELDWQQGEVQPRDLIGEGLDQAVRKQPSYIRFDLRDGLEKATTIAATSAISDSYISGTILLLTFASIALPEKEPICAEEALVYGVLWELANEGVTPVKKREIVEEASSESKSIEEVPDLSPEQVESFVHELELKKCITLEQASDHTLIWLNEEFSVDYEF